MNYWRERNRELLIFLLGGLATLVFGAYDFFAVQIDPDGLGAIRLWPFANLLFALSIAAAVIYRYAQARQDLLTNKLKSKLEVEQAARQERERIMGHLHDTVGAQLTGLTFMIKAKADQHLLVEQSLLTMEDLRIAVNSLQVVEGKLDVSLASFRRVVQPRLDAAGIKLIWRVDVLPAMSHFRGDEVMQVQKILQEVFANILKHADATEGILSAKSVDAIDLKKPQVCVEIIDNGKGFDVSTQTLGIGLGSMQARAKAIGAQLEVQGHEVLGLRQGTKVKLTLPLDAHDSSRDSG
jgi:signal transduction histidine kinase